MTRAKLFSSVAALSLMAVGSVQGQNQVTVKLTEPYAPPNQAAVTAFGYYMSPYSGTVNGDLERLNCVDFFHDVNIGQVWTAYKVNLGDAINNLQLLKLTRDGSNGFLPNVTNADLTNILHVYEEASWLSAQQPLNPGLGGSGSPNWNKTIAIQTAIWAIVDNLPGHIYEVAVPSDVAGLSATCNSACAFSTANSNVNSTGYWINQAQLNYSKQTDKYYGAFNIITDIHKLNDGSIFPADVSAQEFIYMTPEPATWALMATGLGVIAGFGARKRRAADKNDEDVIA